MHPPSSLLRRCRMAAHPPSRATVLQVAAGLGYTCALLVSGTVRCWGENFDGQLANSSRFTSIAGLSHVVRVACGYNHTCAILEDGALRCWGQNQFVKTGWFSPSVYEDHGSAEQDIPGLSHVVDVALGERHTCAVLDDGTDTCARLSDGGLRCWGYALHGETGDGLLPSPVKGISGITQVAAGRVHTCALREDGTVRCWGDNRLGQTGWSPTRSNGAAGSPFEAVPGLSGVTDLRAGFYHSCAMLGTGVGRCWGYDSFGQLGGSNVRTNLPGLADLRLLSPGGLHTCSLVGDGTVHYWGSNSQGELGGSSKSEPVPGLSGVKNVATGGGSTCALLEDGTVRCWGFIWSPKESVQGLSGVTSIVVGSTHACALLQDTTVRCWGSNSYGQRAGSSTADSITGLSGVVELSANSNGEHTCARRVDGTVRCWGRRDQRQTGGASPAQPIPGLRDIIQVSAGGAHGCGLHKDGTLTCWGDNSYGQISGTFQAVVPVELPEEG